MIIGKQFAEKLYSENQEERLYSTGDEMLDNLLERAFCEGYELGQKEFGMQFSIRRQEIDKDKEKLYQDMKNKYPGLYRNKDFVAQYKTLSPEDQKYISNRDADEFTDYIWSNVDLDKITNERETTKLKRNDNNKK